MVVAETGAGRVLAVDADDTVSVPAEGLEGPVDVAFDSGRRCHVSDDRLLLLSANGEGTVWRLNRPT